MHDHPAPASAPASPSATKPDAYAWKAIGASIVG